MDNSPDEIEKFLHEHAPLAGEVALPDAIFWSSAQADFLSEALAEDGDWSEAADALNLALRKQTKEPGRT